MKPPLDNTHSLPQGQISNTNVPYQITGMRAYGIDLCRVMAMSMVVMLHLLGHGGALAATPQGSLSKHVLLLLHAECSCAVVLFFLVSGWLLAPKSLNLDRLLRLAVKVYLISFLVRIIAIPLSVSAGWKSFFADYWFWNAYLIVMATLPILNPGIQLICEKVNSLKLWGLLSALVCLRAMLPMIGVDNNYEPLWFCIPYTVGAALRLKKPCPDRHWYLYLFLAIFIPAFGKTIRFIGLKTGIDIPVFFLPTHYHSPLVLATGMCWLLFFTSLHIRKLPYLLRQASAAAFGVYLLHEHPIVRTSLVKNRFSALGNLHVPELLGALFLALVLIYASSMVVDRTLSFLLDRLQIDSRCRNLCKRFSSLLKPHSKAVF